MQHLEVSGAVRHKYIYVVQQLRVNTLKPAYTGGRRQNEKSVGRRFLTETTYVKVKHIKCL